MNDRLIEEILQSMMMTAPLLALLITGLVLLVTDVLARAEQRDTFLPCLSIAGILGAIGLLVAVGHNQSQAGWGAFRGALLVNDYLVYLSHLVILGGGLFIVLISPRYIAGRAIPQGEYYALLLLAMAAMMALAASHDLLALFINIELLSITLYVLAGIEKRNMRSSEAAFKYFLLGSFAAAFLLLGIAFIYGATGELNYEKIGLAVAGGEMRAPIFLTIGLSLVLIGFGFKLALAPFHMYAPDVYQGAPTPIAAAIATIGKVAVFAAFFHLVRLASAWEGLRDGFWVAFYGVAVASMIIGNIGAIIQPDLKRMLAYSSIAHSGYAIVPLVVLFRHPELADEARDALAYYLLAYTLMTLLAFGVAATLGTEGEGRIARYAGLPRRSATLALMMALAMLSLLGIPPTVGFFGKVYLFKVAIHGGHFWLAIIGMLASVMSAYYYLRVIVTIYMEESREPAGEGVPLFENPHNFVALAVSALGVIFFAIFPWLYLFMR